MIVESHTIKWESIIKNCQSVDQSFHFNHSWIEFKFCHLYLKNMIALNSAKVWPIWQIKSDVETQGEFINFLIKEVQNATYTEISDVEAFVKWLDEELSYLVDERAVLKHFPQWPEQKADAMREAAFGYRDLKNLGSEVSSFSDDMRQPTGVALKRIRALQEK